MRPKLGRAERHIFDRLCFIFPPIEGRYFIWNRTSQWMTLDEIRDYSRAQDIIHLNLRDAMRDPRISKEGGME